MEEARAAVETLRPEPGLKEDQELVYYREQTALREAELVEACEHVREIRRQLRQWAGRIRSYCPRIPGL